MGTGTIVAAGFRKENLPRGTWSFLCRAEMLVCSCRQAFVELSGQIHELEEADDDARAA